MSTANSIHVIPDNSKPAFEKWSELEDQATCLTTRGDWVFRGQRVANWSLKSSLERSLDWYGLSLADARRIEGGLIRRFQRQAQQYLPYLPLPDNYMEWLALMQHYGAPTRLLDWTHSFYVAAFFALDGAGRDIETAVWALNWSQLHDTLHPDIIRLVDETDRNLQKAATFKRVLCGQKLFVIKVTPFRFNQRLIIQQGTFLVPSNVCRTFEDNLSASLKRATPGALIKFRISSDRKMRKEILHNLFRMNITRATLYPGLEGFASSLHTLLINPKILEPPEDWPS